MGQHFVSHVPKGRQAGGGIGRVEQPDRLAKIGASLGVGLLAEMVAQEIDAGPEVYVVWPANGRKRSNQIQVHSH